LNVAGALTNDGSIYIAADDEKLAGAIRGAGNFYLGDGSVLEFDTAVPSSQSVAFNFPSAGAELILDQPSTFQGTIDDFGGGGVDEIDFPTIKYANGDHAVDTGGVGNGKVAIETSAGKTVASFNVYYLNTFDIAVGADASGHVLVTDGVAAANAAIDEIGGGSSADLLGRYDPAFAEPPSTPASDALAFDAWTALGSNAGTYSGGFDFHHDGNAGGARDIWGVGVGWEGSIGHGPGPGS